ETIREAIVLGRSDTAPDQLEGVAHQFPEMFDGKLARLLLSATGRLVAVLHRTRPFSLPTPSRYPGRLQCCLRHTATQRGDCRIISSRGSNCALVYRMASRRFRSAQKALRIVRLQPIEST